MTMIEQLLQQRVTIHTPLFSIRTHLIVTGADEDEQHEAVPRECPRCKAPGLTTLDFYIRSNGNPSSWCKKCTCAHTNSTRKHK